VPPDPPQHPARPHHAIRANAGVCLHPEHIDELLLLQPDVDWFEIHASRYLSDAIQQRSLTFLRQAYPLAIHISQIPANATAEETAAELEALVDLCKPLDAGLISVDLCAGPTGTPDRIASPPCTRILLDTVVSRVDQIQAALNRSVAVSHFPIHSHHRQMEVGEGAFYSELVRLTGCTILVDLSAILQSAAVCNDHPVERLDGLLSAIPHSAISEFHLAGTPTAADHHDRPGLTPEEWTLFTHAARTTGARPCVANHKPPLPDLETLLGEATLLDVLMGLRIPEEDRTSFDVE
jgi:uncharacterized protein (UPF0276 family)